MVLHLVCVIAKDAGVVAGYAHGHLTSINGLVRLLRVEYQAREWIRLSVLKPVMSSRWGIFVRSESRILRGKVEALNIESAS